MRGCGGTARRGDPCWLCGLLACAWSAGVRPGASLCHPSAGLTGSVLGVAWTPDDRLVLGCSADRSVKVYDGLSGREVHTLTGHKDKVTHVG